MTIGRVAKAQFAISVGAPHPPLPFLRHHHRMVRFTSARQSNNLKFTHIHIPFRHSSFVVSMFNSIHCLPFTHTNKQHNPMSTTNLWKLCNALWRLHSISSSMIQSKLTGSVTAPRKACSCACQRDRVLPSAQHVGDSNSFCFRCCCVTLCVIV